MLDSLTPLCRDSDRQVDVVALEIPVAENPWNIADIFATGFANATRRSFLLGGGAAAVSAGLGGIPAAFLSGAAFAQANSRDSLYFGGPILTMADAQPTAEAVLVRDGRIVAVGTRADVETQATGQPAVIDLDGRTMLPGFFDPHSHLVMTGIQALSANLLPPPDGEGHDIAAIQRLLRAWMAENPAIIERYNLVIGFGYDASQLVEQRHPTRHDLDAVSTSLID